MDRVNTNIDIENLRQNMIKCRFTNEIEYININKIEDDNRLNQLNQIIYGIKLFDKYKDPVNEIDTLMYSKNWKYLKPYHRMQKIIEYINTEFTNKSFKKIITKKFYKIIFNGGLRNSNLIYYDPKIQKIEFIGCISFDNNYKFVIIDKKN